MEESDGYEYDAVQSQLRLYGLKSLRGHGDPRSRPHRHRPTTGVGVGDSEAFLLSSRSQAS